MRVPTRPSGPPPPHRTASWTLKARPCDNWRSVSSWTVRSSRRRCQRTHAHQQPRRPAGSIADREERQKRGSLWTKSENSARLRQGQAPTICILAQFGCEGLKMARINRYDRCHPPDGVQPAPFRPGAANASVQLGWAVPGSREQHNTGNITYWP